MKVGYVPYSSDLSAPGDYRRFVSFANKHNISFEIAEFEQEYDVLIVTGAADLSKWIEYRNFETIIIFDLIDSYLNYDNFSFNNVLRPIAKFVARKHKKLYFSYNKLLIRFIKRSNIVVCASEFQLNLINRYTSYAKLIQDDHSSVIRKVKRNYGIKNSIKLVWEGLPSNIYHLKYFLPVFNRLAKEYNIELKIITDSSYKAYGGLLKKDTKKIIKTFNLCNITFRDWSLETFSEELIACDIAIVPLLVKDKLAVGKPNNKISLLYRHKMPVLYSENAATKNISCKKLKEASCKSLESFYVKLKLLISDQEIRKLNAECGFSYFQKKIMKRLPDHEWLEIFEQINVKSRTHSNYCNKEC